MMNASQVQRERLEGRLAELAQRLEKVERNRRRETNPLEQDWGEHAATRRATCALRARSSVSTP